MTAAPPFLTLATLHTRRPTGPGIFRGIRTLALLAALGVGLILIGCDRRVGPWVPAEEEPPPVAGPVRVPGLEKPVPRPMQARGAAPVASSEGGSIRGTVRVGDGSDAGSARVLFVIARSPAGGPPIAVRRLPPGPFPMAFEIGPEDSMIPGQGIAGPVLLSGRLDLDGDPMTRQPGDLVAAVDGAVAPGSQSVELVLRPAAAN